MIFHGRKENWHTPGRGNIAEAPKTAASAVLKASLGEDKYFSYLLFWKENALRFLHTAFCNSVLVNEGGSLTNPIIDVEKKFIHKI